VLQRQGIFTETIGTRVPLIYDPATTAWFNERHSDTDAVRGTRSLDGWTVAFLLNRYPLRRAPAPPTTIGAPATTVDQDQLSVRVDHRFASNRDQLFGRLTRFHENFIPVTPLPEGSGLTTGTLGPQDTDSWAFASSYQRTFSTNMLNEVRDALKRIENGTYGTCRVDGEPIEVLGLPGIPSMRSSRPPFRPFSSAGISSSDRRRTQRLTSGRA
jgi:hypothetical protein